MAVTLVVGSDDSVLEGIAQALGTAGHRVIVTRSLAEAAPYLTTERPVVTLVERAFATDPTFLRLRLPTGGALVVYRTDDGPVVALPAAIQRMTLADLVLPWERQRLVTLVRRVADRAHAAGRNRVDTPPEHRAI